MFMEHIWNIMEQKPNNILNKLKKAKVIFIAAIKKNPKSKDKFKFRITFSRKNKMPKMNFQKKSAQSEFFFYTIFILFYSN